MQETRGYNYVRDKGSQMWSKETRGLSCAHGKGQSQNVGDQGLQMSSWNGVVNCAGSPRG
jgi:hypothetical protein